MLQAQNADENEKVKKMAVVPCAAASLSFFVQPHVLIRKCKFCGVDAWAAFPGNPNVTIDEPKPVCCFACAETRRVVEPAALHSFKATELGLQISETLAGTRSQVKRPWPEIMRLIDEGWRCLRDPAVHLLFSVVTARRVDALRALISRWPECVNYRPQNEMLVTCLNSRVLCV